MFPIYLDFNATTPYAPTAAAAMKAVIDTTYGNPSRYFFPIVLLLFYFSTGFTTSHGTFRTRHYALTICCDLATWLHPSMK